MMTPALLLSTAIDPALAELERIAGIRPSLEARRLLVCIALQESKLRHRRQVTSSGLEDGPAVSFWQFERAGGCRGVVTHPSTAKAMRAVCDLFCVEPGEQGLWAAMRFQDIVAAAAARLLVYTLPRALPQTAADGWSQYLAAWRPGKPHPETWAGHWQAADAAVRRTVPEGVPA